MKNTPYSMVLIRLLISILLLPLTNCSQSGGPGSGGDQIVGADIAYGSWPNESTTTDQSSEIVSKVLISDLDDDGTFENIFITVLPNSSNEKSSILRITTGGDFLEKSNFKSTAIALLQDSIPFSFDFNLDGAKELVMVSYERDRIYAFEFKENLSKIFIRWTANLPENLKENFDRRLSLVLFKDKQLIKVGPYGLYEEKDKKVNIVDLRDDVQ